MTGEVLVIALVRIAGSLPVLRWPLSGGGGGAGEAGGEAKSAGSMTGGSRTIGA